MPAIKWGDVVNKTDEEITLEPGESIECRIMWVGDEVRIESLLGDDVDLSENPVGNYDRDEITDE